MNNPNGIQTILITGGAGYVGSVLVPQLVQQGYKVKVIDLYLYGDNVLSEAKGPLLEEIKGDIRDTKLLERIMPGVDAVIHLACISNDPSFELNPDLGKSINFDCFPDLVKIAKKNKVKRFVYASSSSVYGIKEEPNVSEDLPLDPLTDYSKFKAMCEEVLMQESAPGFTTFTVRPATVCGYSPRLRLDLTVNILTNHAVNNKKILVFGGDQMRPNIHIQDMCDFYLQSLLWPAEKIDRKIYNVGFENFKVHEIAQMVKNVVGDVEIVTTPSDDKRSYHVSSAKIARELGFTAKHTIQEAAQDLFKAFKAGKIPDSMNNSRYYNIKTMQETHLK
jgi:nucleoside-diphosphate-sugar epimerase